MKKLTKKLDLSRETVRQLSKKETKVIAGGGIIITGYPTRCGPLPAG